MIINPISVKKIDASAEVEPITLTEAKAHLRVDHTHDDSYITALISMVRTSAEISTRRCLAKGTAKYRLGYDAYPLNYNKLRIPLPPTIGFDTFGFYNVDNEFVTIFDYLDKTVGFANTIKELEGSNCAFLSVKANYGYESLSRERLSKVIVEVRAGYESIDIPAPIKQAMYLLLTHYYDTREMVAFNRNPVSIPRSVEFLLNQYKVRLT